MLYDDIVISAAFPACCGTDGLAVLLFGGVVLQARRILHPADVAVAASRSKVVDCDPELKPPEIYHGGILFRGTPPTLDRTLDSFCPLVPIDAPAKAA
jgi:hypothetical protein